MDVWIYCVLFCECSSVAVSARIHILVITPPIFLEKLNFLPFCLHKNFIGNDMNKFSLHTHFLLLLEFLSDLNFLDKLYYVLVF